jgi:hypothetical protein
VVVSSLEGNAVVTVRVPETDVPVEQLAHELRLRAHRRLRAAGVFA